MEKIVLLDTAIGSTNRGDEIIMQCAEEELGWLINKHYVLRVPTHLRSFGLDEMLLRFPDSAQEVSTAKYKLACGTNLLSCNMFHRTNQWNINLLNCGPIKNTILVGVGCRGGDNVQNLYTKLLYQRVLSHEYIHSVRTEQTCKILQRLGLKVLNTGCITLWKLTPEYCSIIPKKKSPRVVFTLTDYCRNNERDRQLLKTLQRTYSELYFWVQGAHDMDYLVTLGDISGIHFISSTISAFSEILSTNIDYVGTRLHAGIFAIRHQKRSIIISIDNRMQNMKTFIPNNMLDQQDILSLESKINSDFSTKVNLDWGAINTWKAQFQ